MDRYVYDDSEDAGPGIGNGYRADADGCHYRAPGVRYGHGHRSGADREGYCPPGRWGRNGNRS